MLHSSSCPSFDSEKNQLFSTAKCSVQSPVSPICHKKESKTREVWGATRSVATACVLVENNVRAWRFQLGSLPLFSLVHRYHLIKTGKCLHSVAVKDRTIQSLLLATDFFLFEPVTFQIPIFS